MDFSELIGKTLTAVIYDEDRVIFQVSENEAYVLYHDQDCCEMVRLEDVNGEWDDLIGSPIVRAEENSKKDVDSFKEPPKNEDAEEEEWTFYRIGTKKGTVVLRWYGTSNGYYSTAVNFERVN
ncbi:Uncharacterised protein [uncultured archaeon]|nr:Uncharacterised protein [uncultured archaeon]